MGLFEGNQKSGFGRSAINSFGQADAFDLFDAEISQSQGFDQPSQQNTLFSGQSETRKSFGQVLQNGQNMFGSSSFDSAGGVALFGDNSAQAPSMFENSPAYAQQMQTGGLFVHLTTIRTQNFVLPG